ncbi:MAG: cell division protein DedD [Candidatus Accumulibacter appositus]|uniref:Cell division protein DedD n=1 Tax=Candidatus Accumulibacter appositus TaxID=1454003 RepID=A0A011NVY0_9PROT|nr:SPOR domain-containing protein [Accumulibacter sp.]EXI79471.1 MAG: cell division protein DedD [Candidatus Accumulibacter appositus]HRF04837.1 SPOR domain-containing protein [Accumulibacter sp.]
MQMTESSDPQLHLKKKARRRLVGAVAIAGLAAVVLPMVMDEEPKQPVQDIQIRIPGQEQQPFDPAELAARSSPAAVAAGGGGEQEAPEGAASVAEPAEKAEEERAKTKAVEPAAKSPPKKAEQPPSPPAPAIVKKPDPPPPPPPPPPPVASDGQYVILVGAFADPANVKKLLARIDRSGVPTYTEILNSPAGKRTRVRAGPFPNREAAEKALDKLKKIGVGGVVAGRS